MAYDIASIYYLIDISILLFHIKHHFVFKYVNQTRIEYCGNISGIPLKLW